MCFDRHLGSQLAEMEKLIEKMLQADFSKHASSELHRPTADTVPLADEERLVSILFGMLRLGKFNFVEVYREEAFTALKATVKQVRLECIAKPVQFLKKFRNLLYDSSLNKELCFLYFSSTLKLELF